MAVNWFEGGRRITKLVQGAVVIGGLFYVVFGGDRALTFETLSPDDQWTVAETDCSSSRDAMSFLYDFDLGAGTRRNVTLCFRGQDGGIPYAAFDAARPPNQPPPLVRMPPGSKINDTVRMVRLGDEYSPEVRAYQMRRERDFKTGPRRENWLKPARDGLWWHSWNAFWNRVGEALPWVAGLCFGLWLFSALIGWIVRGFGGIPDGGDFRPN